MESKAMFKDYKKETRIEEPKVEMALVKVVLADDSEIVRRGLKVLLEAEPDIKLVGEADDGLVAIKLVEQLHPDVLVVDLMMKGMSLAAAKNIARQSPKTSIIIYSAESNEAYVLEALRAGVRGYVLKGSTTNELVQAIREAARGLPYLSRPLLERAIKGYSGKRTKQLDPYGELTVREQDVWFMVSRGLTSKEIAERLHISRRTIEVHRLNVRRKLGLKNPPQPLHYSMQEN